MPPTRMLDITFAQRRRRMLKQIEPRVPDTSDKLG